MVPSQPHHPVLLTYKQPSLEAAFTVYHNNAVAKLEQLGGRCGGLVIALYYITNIYRGQPTPFHLTIMTYLAMTACIESVRLLQPRFFSHYREHLQLVKRFCCFCIACTVQEEISAQSSGGSIFDYGMTAAMFSAFENKVRFHLQLVYSLVTHTIGCMVMIAEDNATPFKMLLHAITVAYVPATCVYFWDRRARRAFLQTAEAQQIIQRRAARPGQQRVTPVAGFSGH